MLDDKLVRHTQKSATPLLEIEDKKTQYAFGSFPSGIH